MNQLGASSPLKHIRGFFYPVTEKPEIQAAIDEHEALAGEPGADRVEGDATGPRQLTD